MGRIGMGLVWFILLLHTLRCSHASDNEEVNALSAFKNSITDDPSSALQSWDENAESPCTFFHITCNTNNKITRIDLGESSLSGTLVSDLTNLKSLKFLLLYSNKLNGKIPNQLGNVATLEQLDLSKNSLTGDIPNTLGMLSKLNHLGLGENRLNGFIPQSLTKITTLEYLDLSSNNLSGKVPTGGSFDKFSPANFNNNPNLCYPDISGACIKPPT